MSSNLEKICDNIRNVSFDESVQAILKFSYQLGLEMAEKDILI